MKKFIKLFSALSAILIGFTSTVPFAEAVWPPEDCPFVAPVPTEKILQENFDRAIRNNEAAATYCFFNPDATGAYFDSPNRLAPPKAGTPLENIPVAICLKNDAAKKIFDEHFHITRTASDLPVVEDRPDQIDVRENVFIISFADLNKLSERLAFYTENGILGEPAFRNEKWSWKFVLIRTCLRAEWEGDLSSAPSAEYRVKARVLMDGLREGVRGSTIRLQYADKMVEGHLWCSGWTDKNTFG